MPGSATDSFAEAADYQAHLNDIFAGFVLATPGPFAAHATRATLHHFLLLQSRENLSRVAFVALPPDRVFISFSSDPACPLIWRGLPLEPGEIMLHGRGERLHQRTVGPCRWGFIALPPASLAAAYKTETGSAQAAPALGRILRPSRRDRQHLLRLHREAADLAETRPPILGHPEVVRAMDQELEGALMACLTNSEARTETDVSRRAGDVMVRFEDVLASQPCQKLRLAEVCGRIGVSQCVMHNFCAAFLGVSPQKYMRLRRLHLVRAAIHRADGAGVAELARHAGFTEPSRFAALYRAAFGETPSTTLLRVRET